MNKIVTSVILPSRAVAGVFERLFSRRLHDFAELDNPALAK